jgi:nicotinamidase-related amidase/type 1 glutamine amidotransferase
MKKTIWIALVLLSVCVFRLSAAERQALQFHTRSQVEPVKGSGEFQAVEKLIQLESSKTAIIICDMWDMHWCKGATARVGEMAPRMNQVVKEARGRGVLIIHAPSSTMDFYKDTPQRKKAQQAPKVKAPATLESWRSLNLAKEGPLPIDDSDGGCDDQPRCPGGSPWKRQIATLEIAPEDAISDSGEEVYNLLQQHGIENVIIMGVHTNMCVLGRPFSIRQMVSLGKNVLLMRDMTDTMYNSRKSPFVSHFTGTDLVVKHIEKYWCASVTSADILGGEPFRFKDDKRPTIVFVIGENEYHTWETLPEFAKKELEPRGFGCVYVNAPPAGGNEFENFETIKNADLLLISVRRRTPPTEMMNLIRRHLDSGKPLVGIRTASHAFDAKPSDERHAAWTTFDADVLGGSYQGHFSNLPTLVKVLPESATHPVLAGVPVDAFRVTSSLYKNPKPKPSITRLMVGYIEGRTDVEPVAWVNTESNRRVFYTSLGSPDDFQLPAFRRLLLNGIIWSLDQPVPPAR